MRTTPNHGLRKPELGDKADLRIFIGENMDIIDEKLGDSNINVIDNLTSTSGADALSANQGRVLKNLVDGKAEKSHAHEMADVAGLQTTLNSKADAGHTHVISEVDNLQDELDSKSNVGHKHEISDVSNLQTALNDKAPVIHTHIINDVQGLQGELDKKLESIPAEYVTETEMQTAIEEAVDGMITEVDWTDIQDKPSTFTPSSHGHSIGEVTGLQAELDSKLEEVSWEEVSNKPNAFTPSTHTHSISETTGLRDELDNKSNIGHGHAIGEITNLQATLDGKAPIGHTHTEFDTFALKADIPSIEGLAPIGYVDDRIADLVGSSQETLDTLEELGNALGNDPNFATTITNLIGAKATQEFVDEELARVDLELSGKANINHNHDNTYSKLGHGHEIGEVNGLQTALDEKAPSIHSHAIANVTGLQDALDAKIEEVSWDDVQSRPSTFTPSSHSHGIGEVTGLQAELDSKLEEVSWGDIADKPTSFIPASHTHEIANVNGLQSALDGKAPSSHNHDASTIVRSTTFNQAGSISALNQTLIDNARANRLAFIDPRCVTIEFSNDGGDTWVDAGASDTIKRNMFSGIGGTVHLGALASGTAGDYTVGAMTRITIDAWGANGTSNERYFAGWTNTYMWISTNGATGFSVDIEKSSIGDPDTFSVVRTGIPLSGWSGANDIMHSTITYGGSATQTGQTRRVRFTFKITGVNENYGRPSITEIRAYATNGHNLPNNLARKDRIYSYDGDQNVTFPANVTASTFNGTLNGNATSATQLQTPRNINGVAFNGTSDITITANPNAHTHAITDVANLQSTLDGKASTSHSHTIAQVTGLQEALDDIVAGDISITWDKIEGKPSTFAPSAHSHTWENITEKPTSFTPTTHNHTISEVTNLQATLDGKASTSHNHDGVYASTTHSHAISEVTNLQGILDGKAPTTHTHAIADVTNLQSTLDGKASSSHSHAWGTITDKPTSFTPIAHTHSIGDVNGIQSALDGKLTRINLRGQLQVGSYKRSVIALCDLDNTDVSRSSYSIGTITFHRLNGLTGTATADVGMEKRYNVEYPNVHLTVKGHNGETGVRPCTFMYNGKKYGGLEVFFSSAEVQYIEFYGVGNFEIFGLDYWNTQNEEALNEEVNDSIDFEDFTWANRFTFNGKNVSLVGHTHAISDITNLQSTLDGKASTSHSHTWESITEKPSTFTPSAHSHTIANITGLQDALDGKLESVTWGSILEKPSTFTPSSHAHEIADVTNLQATLNGKLGTNANAVSSTKILVTDSRDEEEASVFRNSRGVYADFKRNAVNGLSDGGTYNGVLTFQPWQDSSGGQVSQLGFTSNANIWHRKSTGAETWGDWRQLAFIDSNVASATKLQTPRTINGVDFDGTANITITANPNAHTHAIGDVTNLQSTLDGKANASHTHTIANITDLQTTLDGKATISALNTTNSNHTAHVDNTTMHITSAERTAWNGKANATHSHAISDVTNLQTTLDGKLGTGANAVSATKLQTARAINGVNFDGTANITITANPTSTEIPENANLNDYQTAGNYYCYLSATAGTLSNSPTTVAFAMQVWKNNGVTQIIMTYQTSGQKMYTRNLYSGTWGAWLEIPVGSSGGTGGNYLPLTGGTLTGILNMNNQNITNVNHMTINDSGVNEGIEWLGGTNWKLYESPDDLTNASGNFQIVQGNLKRVTIGSTGAGDHIIWWKNQATQGTSANQNHGYISNNVIGINSRDGTWTNMYLSVTSGSEVRAIVNASSTNLAPMRAQSFITSNPSMTTPYRNNEFSKVEDTDIDALEIIKDSQVWKYYKAGIDDRTGEMVDKATLGLLADLTHPIVINDGGVDLASMSALTWKAIQQQQEYIEKLEKRIEDLENTLNK